MASDLRENLSLLMRFVTHDFFVSGHYLLHEADRLQSKTDYNRLLRGLVGASQGTGGGPLEPDLSAFLADRKFEQLNGHSSL